MGVCPVKREDAFRYSTNKWTEGSPTLILKDFVLFLQCLFATAKLCSEIII